MAPIYVPEDVLSPSLQDLLDDIDDRLEDWPQWSSTAFTGDGASLRFHIPDRFLVEDTVTASDTDEDGVTTDLSESAYSIDYKTSWATFTVAPTAGNTENFIYEFKHWPDPLLTRLVNNALSYLYPKFYSMWEIDITPDGSSTDYLVESDAGDPPAGICDVEIVSSGMVERLTPFRDYRVLRKNHEAGWIRLFDAPVSSSVVRVRFATRPSTLDALTDRLSDLGLPSRMRESIVCYVCWQALAQKMPARTRTDQMSPVATEGMITFSDQTRSVQLWKLLLDAEVAQSKMRSWAIRGL